MLILAALLLSGAIQADSAAAAAPTPAKAEKKSCRSSGTTGSIMPGKRVCHTRAEWDQIDGANQAQNDRLHDTMHTAGRSNY